MLKPDKNKSSTRNAILVGSLEKNLLLSICSFYDFLDESISNTGKCLRRKKICVKNKKNRQFEISSDLLIPMRTAHKNWLLYRSEHVPLPQALIVVTGPAVLE